MIKDDGSDRSAENLSNITERKITYITPKRHFPVGLPKIIVEKYLEGGQEIDLKKIECHYDSAGNLNREDHYDAHRHHCYSLTWTYDSFGNVIEETNALGHKVQQGVQ